MNISVRSKGIFLTLVGVFAFSPDALLVRLVSTDIYTMIVFKGGLMAVTLIPCIWLFHRGSIREMWGQFGKIDFLFGVLFAVTMFAFVAALNMTSVANVLVMIAIGPVFSSAFAWMMLGDKVKLNMVLVIIACFAGAVIIVSKELLIFGETENISSLNSLLGCLIALIASACIGLNMVLRRVSRMSDSMPGLVLGGFIAAILAMPFAKVTTLDSDQLGYALLLGGAVMPIANTFTFVGPRFISASEVSLLWLLEVALGPLWVWLVLMERPSFHTFLGGGVIVVSLIIYFSRQLQAQSP